MKWSNISIRQYQNICREQNEDYPDDLERSIGLLSCLTGKSIDHYQNDIPVSQLKKELEKVTFLNFAPEKIKLHSKIRVGKRFFKFNFKINTISAGNYIDLTTYVKSQEKIPDNLHLILATLCKEVNVFGFEKKTTATERAEYLLNNMKMPYVFSLSDFFLSNYQILIKNIQSYMDREMEKVEAMISRVSSNIGVGSTH